jgi:hypothetical protein
MGTPLVSFDGKDCSGCKHLNERGYCEFTACIIPCTVRATIPEVKPQTNADRIRSMSDEELAYRLAINECGICPLKEKCFAMQPIKDCEDMWLDWLKQEATL